jgi:ATP-dependent DNA helicase RecQ
MEAYYQETGRAGRDGLPATAWMVYGLQDVVLRQSMIDNSKDSSPEYKKRMSHKLRELLAFCETTICRRKIILEYFGQAAVDNCGNCDACVDPAETIDGTVLAQKFLSCIYYLNKRDQYFGAGHVIDILRGRNNEKVMTNNHNSLSVFGVGSDLDEFQWKSVFRQLLVGGYVSVQEPYSGLVLTDSSFKILKGHISFRIRRDSRKKSLPARKKTLKSSKLVEDKHQELFDSLKEWRLDLSRKKGVPPYTICGNASLVSLCEMRPQNSAELLNVYGFGEKKVATYGREILTIIQGAIS